MELAIQLGRMAALAAFQKRAVTMQKARAGRTAKGQNMQKQLHAAGQPKMNTPGVFAYPRGQRV